MIGFKKKVAESLKEETSLEPEKSETVSGAVSEVAEEVKPRTRRKRVSAIAPQESKSRTEKNGADRTVFKFDDDSDDDSDVLKSEESKDLGMESTKMSGIDEEEVAKTVNRIIMRNSVNVDEDKEEEEDLPVSFDNSEDTVEIDVPIKTPEKPVEERNVNESQDILLKLGRAVNRYADPYCGFECETVSLRYASGVNEVKVDNGWIYFPIKQVFVNGRKRNFNSVHEVRLKRDDKVELDLGVSAVVPKLRA